jgi:hypothetical protein
LKNGELKTRFTAFKGKSRVKLERGEKRSIQKKVSRACVNNLRQQVRGLADFFRTNFPQYLRIGQLVCGPLPHRSSFHDVILELTLGNHSCSPYYQLQISRVTGFLCLLPTKTAFGPVEQRREECDINLNFPTGL